jgi:hypothetical protein
MMGDNMLTHRFKIMDCIDSQKDYSDYFSRKDNCIFVNDEIILLVIKELKIMPTFYHNLNRPEYGLAYWGVTLIPPTSLKTFKDVLLGEKCIQPLELNQLIVLINTAIEENKYIIHCGV